MTFYIKYTYIFLSIKNLDKFVDVLYTSCGKILNNWGVETIILCRTVTFNGNYLFIFKLQIIEAFLFLP